MINAYPGHPMSFFLLKFWLWWWLFAIPAFIIIAGVERYGDYAVLRVIFVLYIVIMTAILAHRHFEKVFKKKGSSRATFKKGQ